MTDHPIIFKNEMVRAIRDGCKTQTRRIIKPQPTQYTCDVSKTRMWEWRKGKGRCAWAIDMQPRLCAKQFFMEHCPYGVPGDLLWVKESHWISTCGQYIAMPGGRRNHYPIPPDSVCSTKSVSTDIRSAGRRFELQDGSVIHAGSPVASKGEKDMLNCVVMIDGHRRDLLFRRRSPLFMPKWACRLWLKVKSVRVERVQEISDEDVVSEGIESFGWDFAESSDGTGQEFMYWADVSRDMPNWCPDGTTSCECATDIFSYLWDSISAKPKPQYRTVNGEEEITHYESYPWKNIHQTRRHRGKPWHVYGNPHVFATEFERYEQ